MRCKGLYPLGSSKHCKKQWRGVLNLSSARRHYRVAMALPLAVSSSMSLLLAGSRPLHVCVVSELGFAMPKEAGVNLGSITSDEQLFGFDVALRKDILQTRMGLANWTVTLYSSYGEAQVHTRMGTCDIGWSPYFLIGSRERCTPSEGRCMPISLASSDWEPQRCCVDFSMQYMRWQVGIMYPPTPSTDFGWSIFEIFVEPFFINFFCLLFLWIIIFGHGIWLAERLYNPHFPLSYMDGLDDGVWWAAVTVTTVGYGDKVPRTVLGRLLGMLWMLYGIGMCAILTGHMGSRYLEKISSTDLSASEAVQAATGKRVCSYAAAFDQDWFPTPSCIPVFGENVSECAELLRTGLVDAIVMDLPILAYFRNVNQWAAEMRISPLESYPAVGIIFPEVDVGESLALRTEVNAHLMDF